MLQREVARVHAVDDVSFSVRRGETLGLVGESGCGKSTSAAASSGSSSRPTAGDLPGPRHHQARAPPAPAAAERDADGVPDLYASLNPRKRVGSIIGDPLKIHGIGSASDRKRRVQELLETVGLSPEHYNRFPHEFSGGQRQRIGASPALALRPKLIVADEPVSALDVSIQSQILNLLTDLQEEFDLTFIFIAHDLGVVRHVSDRIAVMYLGKLVELAGGGALLAADHAVLRGAALGGADPDPDLAERRERIVLTGDVPSRSTRSGCRFHLRCRYMTDVCKQVEPPLTDYGGHLAACHHPLNVSTEEALRAEAAANTPVSAPEEATPTEPAGRRSQPVPTDTPRSG